MRTICDACEGAVATFFCAADEAALCPSCDEKVHMCNKLASRHVRVGIADPSDVPRCDICEKAPAFFYCEVDGTSLCLQCDMVVHVGGKKTHSRYLLLRQRVKFPGDNSGSLEDLSLQPMDTGEIRREQNQSPRLTVRENMPDHRISPVPILDGKNNDQNKIHTKMFDLNTRPNRIHGQASNNQ